MAALCNGGHYILVLWFLPYIFFSSPNLSRRRLDVCHTSTHGVALVRILKAGLKRAARGSLEIKDAKNRQKFAIWEPSHNFCWDISSQLRHVSTIGKNLLNNNISPHMSLQYGELRRTIGCDLLASLGHHCKFQRVSRLGSVTARHSSSGRQPNCGVEQRAPPIFGRATITLGIGPHF